MRYESGEVELFHGTILLTPGRAVAAVVIVLIVITGWGAIRYAVAKKASKDLEPAISVELARRAMAPHQSLIESVSKGNGLQDVSQAELEQLVHDVRIRIHRIDVRGGWLTTPVTHDIFVKATYSQGGEDAPSQTAYFLADYSFAFKWNSEEQLWSCSPWRYEWALWRF